MKSDIEEQKSKTRSENIELNQKKIKNGKEETLKDMLKEVDDEVKREEIIHMLLEQKVSKKKRKKENFHIKFQILQEALDLFFL